MATDRRPRRRTSRRSYTHPDGYTIDLEYDSSYRYISSDDSPISKAPYKDQLSKSCYHWRATTGLSPLPLFGYVNNGGNSVYSTEMPTDDLRPFSTVSRGEVLYHDRDISKPGRMGAQPDIFVPDIDSLLNREIMKMAEEWSILNFLFELDDIPRLLRKLVDLTGDIHRPPRRIGGVSRVDIPDTTLAINLGLMPLISDLEAIQARFFGWSERCANVARSLQRGFRIVTGRTLDLSTEYRSPSQIIQVNESSYKEIYGAVITADTPLGDGLGSTLAQFGLFGNPLQILWNATPFSFLVDYVIPVGDYFTQQHFMNPSIRRSWATSKTTGDFQIFRRYGNSHWYTTQVGAYTEYTRSNIAWDRFDGAQAAIRPYGIHLMNPTQWQNVLALSRNLLRE